MEIGELLQLREVETAFSQLGTCPKCKSVEGFWLGLRQDHVYAQCKYCGSKFELREIHNLDRPMKSSQSLKSV